MHCCLKEHPYNRFYAYLLEHLCRANSSHKYTLQYALWDHFKELDAMPDIRETANLCRLLAHLLLSRALSLAVLRTIDWIHLSNAGNGFFQSLFLHVLQDAADDAAAVRLFDRIARVEAHALLCDSLQLYLRTHVRRAASERGCLAAVRSRLRLARRALARRLD